MLFKDIAKICSLPRILFGIAALALLIISLPSLAQQTPQPDATPQISEQDRAGQRLESQLLTREATLRQAEDDLLKQLSASLQPSDSAQNSKPPAAAPLVGEVFIAETVEVKTNTASASVSLEERLVVGTDKISDPKEAAPSTVNIPVNNVLGIHIPPSIQLECAKCSPPTVQKTSTTSNITQPKQRTAKKGTAKKGTAKQSPTKQGARTQPQVVKHSPPITKRKNVSDVLGHSASEDFTYSGNVPSCCEGIDHPYRPTSEHARVTTAKVPLRVGPGRSESMLFMMPRDSIVSIEMRNGEWYRVITSTGVRGWIAAQSLIFDYQVPASSSVRVGAFKSAYEPTGIKF